MEVDLKEVKASTSLEYQRIKVKNNHKNNRKNFPTLTCIVKKYKV